MQPEALGEQIAAGVVGLAPHEDRGSTPAAIDYCPGLVSAQGYLYKSARPGCDVMPQVDGGT